jgi:Beta-mannanase
VRWLLPSFLFVHCLCGKDKPLEPVEPVVVCDGGIPYVNKSNAQRFGLYSETLTDDYATNLNSLIATFGVKPAYVLWFIQIDDTFPATFIIGNTLQSISTVISMNIRSKKLDLVQNLSVLHEISLGRWDTTLHSFARQAAQLGTVFYFRFGFEMNINWFPWDNKPDDFVHAWNHTHKIFEEEKATNVVWVFSPGVLFDTMTFQGSILPYYPGDSVVDITGLDGYNFGDRYDIWHHWETFSQVFGKSLIELKKLGKPIWITETGCVSDRSRPGWLEDLFQFMDANPCIGAMLWFNAKNGNEPDFRLESDSSSLECMRNWIGK